MLGHAAGGQAVAAAVVVVVGVRGEILWARNEAEAEAAAAARARNAPAPSSSGSMQCPLLALFFSRDFMSQQANRVRGSYQCEVLATAWGEVRKYPVPGQGEAQQESEC